jgi:hypothetical protein
LTRAKSTRVHFCSQHWLQCLLGLYKFEFEFNKSSGVGTNFGLIVHVLPLPNK